MSENPNEEQNKKQLLGSKLLDDITAGLTDAGQSIVEASKEDDTKWTDDAIRIGLGGAKNVGNVLNAPGIKESLQALGLPAWVAGQGLGWTLEKAGVDPRYGHIAGEVGEWFIPFYGAGKLVKSAKRLGALTDIARGGGMAANVGTGLDKASDFAAIEKGVEKTAALKGLSVDDALTREGLYHRIKTSIDGQGSLFDDSTDFGRASTPAPTPAWGPEALKQAMIDPRYANEYVEFLQASGKTGYETLKLFKKNILNKMPDRGKQLFRLLNEADYREGMVEHLVAKGEYMDWYWEPWGLNKGDRHALSNVRILFNDRFDRFKTTVENIIRNPKTGYQNSPNLADRIIVGVEHAGGEIRKVSGVRVQDIRNPGDIVLKRAGSGRVLGKLGQYLDALYPQGKAAIKVFKNNLEKYEGVKGGKAIIEWRKKVLTERIEKIIAKHGELPKKDWLAREKIQNAINEDMAEFHAKYHWLPQPTAAKKYFKQVSAEKRTGPFLPKTLDLDPPGRGKTIPKSG